MKQPKTTHLRIDTAGTKKIRSAMRRARSIKITINIDADSLSALRETVERTGMPYQRLLNNILKEGLANQNVTEDRFARIEKEIARIKRGWRREGGDRYSWAGVYAAQPNACKQKIKLSPSSERLLPVHLDFAT